MSNSEIAALLREALREAGGSSPSDEALRATLRSGVVGDDPILNNVYEQEAGPEQAEADLHLEGPGVESHSTNALQFSRFVSGMSEAVKQTAKFMSGRAAYSNRLLIEGATPGSVRVVFRVPSQMIPEDQTADPATVASSVDSDALRTVVSILGHASDTDPNSPLAAELSELPPQARTALRRMVSASEKGGWNLKGAIRQRHIGLTPVEFTHEGVVRLKIELQSTVERRRESHEIGRVDGFRWSLGSLYFIPSRGNPFTAGVVDGDVAHRVTELMADPDQSVSAVFDVVESHLPGDNQRPRVSRILKRIAPLGVQQRLDDPTPPMI
ncbi:calponin homology domain-containing protein [Gordonia polyisoprenivorans]|uniref:calponin homology domain-containing protein n=1 Tax=Gordonia polyisoprenivorans TaxID=84595 RepID=UPI002234A259|nr:calponin homology domain-containing protein [Gordonia polyisoprenivorans]